MRKKNDLAHSASGKDRGAKCRRANMGGGVGGGNQHSKMTAGNNAETARKRLLELIRRGQKLGLSPKDVASLPASRRLVRYRDQSASFFWRSLQWVAVVLLASFVAAVLRCYTSPELTISPWKQDHSEDTACSVNMPQQLVGVFRPPEDCAMCRGLRNIDRVANISWPAFQQRYTTAGHPVVVTDAMQNWTAQYVFDFDFLKTVYKEFQQSQNCQIFASSAKSTNLDDSNASVKTTFEPWHISWRNCDERVAAILRQHYGPPYFLPPGGEKSKLEWIYLGSPGYRETTHVEALNQPSWQAQLRGTKRWFLHPPPECFYQCESLEATLNPGEIIVVDSARWYHETTVISEEYSVTVGAHFDIT